MTWVRPNQTLELGTSSSLPGGWQKPLPGVGSKEEQWGQQHPKRDAGNAGGNFCHNAQHWAQHLFFSKTVSKVLNL